MTIKLLAVSKQQKSVAYTASAGLMHNLPKIMVVPDSAGDAS